MSGQGDALVGLVSFSVRAEVGQPLRFLFIFTVTLAMTFGNVALLLILFLLLALFRFLLRFPRLLDLLISGILAKFVSNVLMRKVAFLRPHMIVRDAAEAES